LFGEVLAEGVIEAAGGGAGGVRGPRDRGGSGGPAELACGGGGAADDLRQAPEIFQRIGATEADEVSGELAALSKAAPPA
jgi:hypothetical protein